MSDKPKQEEQKTERFNMFMSPSEMKAIDDWAWQNKIRSKSEAVRRLCQTALNSEQYVKESMLELEAVRNGVIELGDTIVDLIRNDADIEAVMDRVFTGLSDLHSRLYSIQVSLDKMNLTEGIARSPVLQHLSLEERFQVAKDLMNLGKGDKK